MRKAFFNSLSIVKNSEQYQLVAKSQLIIMITSSDDDADVARYPIDKKCSQSARSATSPPKISHLVPPVKSMYSSRNHQRCFLPNAPCPGRLDTSQCKKIRSTYSTTRHRTAYQPPADGATRGDAGPLCPNAAAE